MLLLVWESKLKKKTGHHQRCWWGWGRRGGVCCLLKRDTWEVQNVRGEEKCSAKQLLLQDSVSEAPWDFTEDLLHYFWMSSLAQKPPWWEYSWQKWTTLACISFTSRWIPAKHTVTPLFQTWVISSAHKNAGLEEQLSEEMLLINLEILSDPLWQRNSQE